jgi:hypothetical protein
MNTTPPPAPSAFVTATAWAFILLGALMVLTNLAQLLFFAFFVPSHDFEQLTRDMASTMPLPEWMKFIIAHLLAWIGLMFLLSAATVVASIGLLMRRNWARLVFIAMMWIGVAWNLVGAAAPLFMRDYLASLMQSMPPEAQGDIGAAIGAMSWVAAVVALVFAILFAWTAIKLASAQIRREFGAA